MLDEEKISRITKHYWHKWDESQIDERLKWYVTETHTALDNKSLLEAELEWARSKGNIKAQTCQTLALLVGFSLEPLLQSVCVYQPQKIVLLLNQEGYLQEEWHEFSRHVTEAVEHLKKRGLIQQMPSFPGEDRRAGYPVKGSPEAVFQKLVEVLRDETDVVIDVTGGKKSMVSGAYLYAAYSGARISYVDFDKYDPKYRRPYGHSCIIGELANPYETFALRDWEQVRSLYGRYQFREARGILEDRILPVMKQVLPASEGPIQRLVKFMEYYESWDGGDFRRAKQLGQEIGQDVGAFNQPSAVTELGDIWFETETNPPQFKSQPQGFYGQVDKFKVYVCDELARIRRLIDYNEDYRSAFLRAGAVNEIIMVARLVAAVADPNDRRRLLDSLDKSTPPIRHIFLGLTQTNLTISRRNTDIRWSEGPDPAISVTQSSPMTDWWNQTMFKDDCNKQGWERLLDIRNKLAHTYLSVPRKWAENALEFVRTNFKEWMSSSADCSDFTTSALPWAKVCGLTGVGNFLPPNLRREAQP